MSPEELLRLADAAEGNSGPFRYNALVDLGYCPSEIGIALLRRVARVEMAAREAEMLFLAMCGVTNSGSAWYPRMVDASDALRQALDHEEGDESDA